MLLRSLFSVVAFSILIQQSASGDVCSKCKCQNWTIDCSSRNITRLPSLTKVLPIINTSVISFENNLLEHVPRFPKLLVKQLTLSRNQIVTIDESAFKNLTNLTILDLSHNLLTTEKLLPNVFKGYFAQDLYEPLRNLKSLNLAHNLLHSLHQDLFEHLPNLEILMLNDNPLRIISHGVLAALSSVPLLKELNLSGTGLASLPDSLLHAPKYLEILDLSNNLFTEAPAELEKSHHIRWLSLNANPIIRLEQFPSMPFLETLYISKMPKLISMDDRALSGLPKLQEFYCYENRRLVQIGKNVFSKVLNPESRQGEGEVWPPLKVVSLRNNSLRSIDYHLIGRWDNLRIADLQNNPWLCDCENQWLVSVLAPMIENTQPELLKHLKCGTPVEMENLYIVDLYHREYEMRCLDAYNHKPEKDAYLLLEICVLLIILAPILMVAILSYKYRCQHENTSIISLQKRDLCRDSNAWTFGTKMMFIALFAVIFTVALFVQIGFIYYKKLIQNRANKYQEMFNDNFHAYDYTRFDRGHFIQMERFTYSSPLSM